MRRQRLTNSDHLDEIAGLLAQGYVRLQEKQASAHTFNQHALDGRAGSLDSICQAERSLAGHQSQRKEKVHGDHV